MDPAAFSTVRAPHNADLYIETPEALSALVRQLDDAPWLAIDTEFLREKTYRARLCLLQIGAPGLVACIDPLAVPDLSDLRPLLCNNRITKILHAARQDLEILYQTLGEIPAPVFDTQIAAALLGQGEQIGYGRLVAEVLDVTLEKGHARTDWSKRPLDQAQLHYAANDVRYLGALYSYQHAALDSIGRLAWLEEESGKLIDPDSYLINPEDMWQRLKGIQNLKGGMLPIAQALAAWRERQAMAVDRPRRWILADELIIDMARRAPATNTELRRIRGLPEKIARYHGDIILMTIDEAQKRPESDWPVLHERLILDKEQEALAERLVAALRHEALSQNISPPILATRRDLERLASGETDLPIMTGWRAGAVGNQLKAVIEDHASSSAQERGAPAVSIQHNP